MTIPAERAYGPYEPELVLAVDRAEFPEDIEPEVGQELQVRQGDEVLVVRITAVSDEEVTIDVNHPLAGQNLTFDLELVAVRGQEPRRRDLKSGWLYDPPIPTLPGRSCSNSLFPRAAAPIRAVTRESFWSVHDGIHSTAPARAGSLHNRGASVSQQGASIVFRDALEVDSRMVRR